MDGDGYASLIVATCNQSTNDTHFYEIGSRKNNYEVELIFQVSQKIDCANISDMVAGDFDGDGKDELAVGSNFGVHIFDDSENSYAFMTKHVEQTGYSTSNVYRLAAKNIVGKSYDDLGVVVYNSSENSKFRTKAYLFEMNGMEYKPSGEIVRDYRFFTFNIHNLDFTTPADIFMDDIENIGRSKMYVIQLSSEEESQKYDVDEWKERHDKDGIGFESDNHWCTYRGYYKNYVDLWSVDSSPTNPDAYNIEALNKVGQVAIVNRISKSFEKGVGACKDSDEIYLTQANIGYSDQDAYGHIFSITKSIDAVSYRSTLDDVFKFKLNGIPLSYSNFQLGGDFEVSSLYSNSYYSANSADSVKPTLKDNNYSYEDISSSNYNYINSFIEDIDNDSYFTHNSDIAIPYHHHGNRGSSKIGSLYSLGGGEYQIKYGAYSYPNDSLIMRYVRHNVLYTDPQVLLYLSAPPVKAGQKSTFTYSTGSCDEESEKDSKSNGFTSGFSMLFGMDVDIPLVNQDDVLGGFSTKYKWSRDRTNFSSSSKCINTDYTSSSDYTDDTSLHANDLVKIRSEVIDSYVYEIVDDLNNPDNIGKEMTVNDTREEKLGTTSYYTIWKTVDDYYDILEANNKEPYVDFRSLITHNAGEINSYMSYSDYEATISNRENRTVDGYKYNDFFATNDYQVQQNDLSDVTAVGYSITNKNGDSVTDGSSYSFAFKTKIKAAGGFIIQVASEGVLELGWTTSSKVTYSSSHSDKASYKFKASGATTQEDTSGVYKYGAFTYSLVKSADEEDKGHAVQVIDFYVTDY